MSESAPKYRTHPKCAGGTPTIDDPTAYFCGALDLGTCSGTRAANIAGVCAGAYLTAAGGVTNAARDTVLGSFFDKATAVGMANNIYACDVDNDCSSKCP